MSAKAAREVCAAIKGMQLQLARSFLEDVVSLKKAVPFRRFKKEGAHRVDAGNMHTGRFPAKTAKEFLEALENLEANAEFKGLDTDRLVIIHASANKGRVVRGFTPRGFGKSSPSNNVLVHLELVAAEG